MKGPIAALGPVMQLAFLPSDFDAALAHWTGVIGAGPFFLLENVALADMRYRGEPSDAVFSLAIGYWGDLQIELIRPENNARSIYAGEYGVRDRLHHVCVLVDDMEETRRATEQAGAVIVLEARVGEEGAVLYVDPGGGPGNLVELLRPERGTPELFAMMRNAARDWDGCDPVRRLG